MRTRLHTPALPPVTDEHRRRAYASLGIAHRFPTFEAALTSDTHRRVIEAYAHQLRTRDAMHRTTYTRYTQPTVLATGTAELFA